MFKSLPNRENGGSWYSFDAVSKKHVQKAIAEAEKKNKEAEQYYEETNKKASEEEIDSGWPYHASFPIREAASLARVSAVLLTALHIEGGINSWGVYVTGEYFFKEHIERISFESKTAIIIALSGNGIIPRNHESITSIRNLFERRNQIVHRKTKEGIEDPNWAKHMTNAALNDLETCKIALNAFHNLVLSIDQTVAFLVGAKDNDYEA